MKMLGFTFCRRSVTEVPVRPEPTTSPIKFNVCGGNETGTVVILVTNPLLFTVTTGINVPLPNVPGAKLTVVSVNTPTPGPLAVPSPDRPVR